MVFEDGKGIKVVKVFKVIRVGGMEGILIVIEVQK